MKMGYITASHILLRKYHLFAVQHVLLKPPVKGLENDVAGPPPSEPE